MSTKIKKKQLSKHEQTTTLFLKNKHPWSYEPKRFDDQNGIFASKSSFSSWRSSLDSLDNCCRRQLSVGPKAVSRRPKDFPVWRRFSMKLWGWIVDVVDQGQLFLKRTNQKKVQLSVYKSFSKIVTSTAKTSALFPSGWAPPPEWQKLAPMAPGPAPAPAAADRDLWPSPSVATTKHLCSGQALLTAARDDDRPWRTHLQMWEKPSAVAENTVTQIEEFESLWAFQGWGVGPMIWVHVQLCGGISWKLFFRGPRPHAIVCPKQAADGHRKSPPEHVYLGVVVAFWKGHDTRSLLAQALFTNKLQKHWSFPSGSGFLAFNWVKINEIYLNLIANWDTCHSLVFSCIFWLFLQVFYWFASITPESVPTLAICLALLQATSTTSRPDPLTSGLRNHFKTVEQ